MYHSCKGDLTSPTHDCDCEIGRNHTASEHRQRMRSDANSEAFAPAK